MISLAALTGVSGGLCAFTRAAAFLSSAPVVSERGVPRRFRAGAAVVLAGLLAPGWPALSAGELAFALPGEAIIGLAAGYAARLPLLGLEAGGQLIGHALGLGFAGIYDPTAGEMVLPTRRLVASLGGLAFLAAGGLESCVLALAAPPARVDTLAGAVRVAIEGSLRTLPIALALAGPALCAAVAAGLALALVSRAVPALNAFSVLLALSLAVVTVAVLATAPLLSAEAFHLGRRVADAAHEVLLP